MKKRLTKMFLFALFLIAIVGCNKNKSKYVVFFENKCMDTIHTTGKLKLINRNLVFVNGLEQYTIAKDVYFVKKIN